MAPPALHVVAWLLSMTMVASGVPMGYEYPAPEAPFIEGAQVSTTPAPDCVPGDLQDNPYYTSLLDMGVPLCPSENQYDDYDPSDIPADQAAPVEDLPTYTEAPVVEYDEYDPNDIPEDQAAPATEGYNYPVPENPLTLPTKPTTTPLPLPDCVPAGEEAIGDNPFFLDQGVPFCPEELPVYTEAPVAPVEIYEEEAAYEYDEYDPSDIPEDQAAPEEVTEGYNYPVPENPLILPTKPTTIAPLPLPDCVPAGEEDLGDNPFFLDQGVPLCPEELPAYTEAPVEEYDEYDPSDIPEDQAAPVEDLPTYTEAPVVEYDEYDPNDIPEDQAAPVEVTEGYNYPVPENPLTLPTKPTTTALPLPDCVTMDDPLLETYQELGVELCPIPDPVLEYDEYDPNDIPEDQAAPATEGYNYPVPENPLTLPSRARKAKVVVDKEDELTIGLTHLDTDSYDPGNYDHNSPDYIEEEEVEEERTSEVTHQGRRTQQPGISLTGPGHVISFHVPAGHIKMVEEQRAVEEFGGERHADPFTNLLGGELIPPVLRRMKAGRKTHTGMVNTVEDEESSRKEVKQTGRFNKGRNHRNRNRKNKNRRNQAHKQKQEKKEKNKSTTTSTTTTTKRPRGGRKLSSRKTAKGRQNISVQAWLRRG